MISADAIEKQLKRLRFNMHGWGKSEARELPSILLPDEQIYELVNGIYEGGFALLVATDVRVLLVDKKPLNYLTVEDFRFDMISEIDYSHRLVGARISISTGSKNLRFTSYNQPRLRKLITHVQHCMADQKKQPAKHQIDQKTHLEQINQQLQAYLIAQHQQQQELQKRFEESNGKQPVETPEPIKPSPELSDFLFAQSLLTQYKAENPNAGVEPQAFPGITLPAAPPPAVAAAVPQIPPAPQPTSVVETPTGQLADLYAEGFKEVFGKQQAQAFSDHQPQQELGPSQTMQQPAVPLAANNPLEINPLRIAYSKLPMALRNRKFGRPSFHAHSQQPADDSAPQPAGAQA